MFSSHLLFPVCGNTVTSLEQQPVKRIDEWHVLSNLLQGCYNKSDTDITTRMLQGLIDEKLL